MRLLRICYRVPPAPGGQEVHISELTRELSHLGVEQTVVFVEGDPTSLIGARAIPVAPPRPANNIIFKATIMAFRTYQAVRGVNFDIVHSHGDPALARTGSFVAARLGATHFHTMHASLPRSPMVRAACAQLLPKGSQYYAVGPQVAEELVGLGVSPSRVVTRPSGVRSAFFGRHSRPRLPLAVIGGRLVEQKSILCFVQHWADSGVEDARLAVFGSGPDALSIQRIANDDASIDFYGELDETELAKLFSTAAVGLVFSTGASRSQGGEGTPTVGLEMLAAGCHLIACGPVGELSRILDRTGAGYHCRSAPLPSEVVALIRKVIGMETEATCSPVPADHYCWPAVAQEIFQAYQLARIG